MQCAACGNGQEHPHQRILWLALEPREPSQGSRSQAGTAKPTSTSTGSCTRTECSQCQPAALALPPTPWASTLGNSIVSVQHLQSSKDCEPLLSSPTAVSVEGEANASSAQWAQIPIRPQHNTGGNDTKQLILGSCFSSGRGKVHNSARGDWNRQRLGCAPRAPGATALAPNPTNTGLLSNR